MVDQMLYKIKGKNIKIPDHEVENLMKNYELTKDNAIKMWLEDEGLIENEEIEKITKQAKMNKAVKHGAYSDKQKQKRNRPKKEDPEKENVILMLSEFLIDHGFQNVIIENKSKIITFIGTEGKYKLDLSRKRENK